MNIILTVISTIISIFILLVLYQACKTLKIYIQYKQKYGDQIKFLFFPFLGIVYFMQQSLKKHNDGSHYIKQICRENPQAKAIIILSGLFNYFIALDNEWIKHLSQDQERFYKNDGCFAYSSFFGDSVIIAKGKTWKRQRLLLNSSFHYEALKSRVPVIKGEAKNFLKNMKPEEGFVKVDLFNETQKITSEVISRTFFNRELKQEKVPNGKYFYKEIGDIAEDTFKYRMSSLYFIFKSSFLGNTGASYVLNTQTEKKLLTRINDCMNMIETYVNDSIKQVIDSQEDILTFQPKNFSEVYAKEYLIQQQNIENIPQADRITKREIIQQYNAFIFAGTDTTSHLISMTLYALSLNPSVYNKLQQEIDEKVKSYENFEHNDLLSLTYLDAVIKETTRLYYVVPTIFPRRTDEDYQREDLYISKDLCVQYRIAQFSEKESMYKDSDQYIPERFLDNPKTNPYDFIPFSSGSRNCIGQHLAVLEGKYVLLYILKNFEVKPIPNYTLKTLQFLINQPLDKEMVYIQKKSNQK